MSTRPWSDARAVLLAAAVLSLHLPAALATNTVVVLNFANTAAGPSQDKHRWLSKGLADLVINDLSASDRLRVVTREDMQRLMAEADLADRFLGASAFPATGREALQLYLAAERLVFGTFTVADRRITLETDVIDGATGRLLSHFREEGDLEQVLNLEKVLARKLLTFLEGGEVRSVPLQLPRWTDSVSASQHLYEGIELFDRGDFTLAWYEFRQALNADPGYADAHYWLARMYYYRQDYEHARLEYDRFGDLYPKHPLIGDAVMEYVYTYEQLSGDPKALLRLYRSFRKFNWTDILVHNQLDYASTSPLFDWVSKREVEALLYRKRYVEAFDILAFELADPFKLDVGGNTWRVDTVQQSMALAELSEDANGERLHSFVNWPDEVTLTTAIPSFTKDLRALTEVRDGGYSSPFTHRFLAEPGFFFKKLKVKIERTNDPTVDSLSILQVYRYRYVDIKSCRTSNKSHPNNNYVFDVVMPPGCTWFYTSTKYDGRTTSTSGHRPKASFDGWRIDAEMARLGEVGRVDLTVSNTVNYRVLVDGVYARCFNGVIPNLAPGAHKIRIESMWSGAWGLEPKEATLTVVPNATVPYAASLTLSQKARNAGWVDPTCIASEYPIFKLRTQRRRNWRAGHPSMCIDPKTGDRIVVWSHLDDLWMSTAKGGTNWSPIVSMDPPINSAHAELNPRLIRDESGRYCLLFASDRGSQRRLASYVCWSRDLIFSPKAAGN